MIICLILEGETALLTVGADILLFILIYVISRWNAGRKCREWKKSVVPGEMCEYGMFRIRYLDQIEFECAEGKKIIYRMDRERRILDGMEIGGSCICGSAGQTLYGIAKNAVTVHRKRLGDADQG